VQVFVGVGGVGVEDGVRVVVVVGLWQSVFGEGGVQGVDLALEPPQQLDSWDSPSPDRSADSDLFPQHDDDDCGGGSNLFRAVSPISVCASFGISPMTTCPLHRSLNAMPNDSTTC